MDQVFAVRQVCDKFLANVRKPYDVRKGVGMNEGV